MRKAIPTSDPSKLADRDEIRHRDERAFRILLEHNGKAIRRRTDVEKGKDCLRLFVPCSCSVINAPK